MPTWVFFLGLQAIIVIICAVWCVQWIKSPLDDDDKLLEAMALKYERQDLEAYEKAMAEQEAKVAKDISELKGDDEK